MSSLRNGAVSALAFAGGSLIAALYTHYQNKASTENESESESCEENQEMEDVSRLSRRRRTKFQVDLPCSEDVPSTPHRRIDPRSKDRRTTKRPRKALKPPSSPLDTLKQEIGLIEEFKNPKGNRDPPQSQFYAQSPSMRSNSSGGRFSLSNKFDDFGPPSPSFGPEERELAMFADDDVKEQVRDIEKEKARTKRFRLADSPMQPTQLFYK